MRSSRGKVKLLPGVRASEQRAGRGGSARGGPTLLPGAVAMAECVPERGGWARGRGEGFGGGVGVGATSTAPLSRDEDAVLLGRCALPGSRCAPNFKTRSACWRSVSVNLGTSSLAFWLRVCARACLFVRLSFLVTGGKNKRNLCPSTSCRKLPSQNWYPDPLTVDFPSGKGKGLYLNLIITMSHVSCII